MAGRNRWIQPPVEVTKLPGPERPREDNCCCPWFKPNSKSNKRSDAGLNRWTQPPVQVTKLPGPDRPREDNCCCPWFKPNSKSNKRSDAPFTEIDPVETTKNGAVNEFNGKQVWTHDQENSDGIPRNMKPIPQNQKNSSPGQGHLWEDNKQEESKKQGKNTGPNSTNASEDIPKEEDNVGSYGGTRPDSTKNKGNHGGTRSDPTKSSTFEQAGPWKEKENDRIKNRQEDILEDHRKAVHKPEYNHGIDRDKGKHGGTRSDPTKSSTFENDHIKNRHEGILEDHDHQKGVHKPEYNHKPDLTKKESSSPGSEQGRHRH